MTGRALTRLAAAVRALGSRAQGGGATCGAALDAAAKTLAELWLYNIYPERAVSWGTYVSHLGHAGETPERHGCFRCHGTMHKDAEGNSPSQSCSLCHEVIAIEEDPEDLEEGAALLYETPR